MANYGNPGSDSPTPNEIIDVNLDATENDNFFFVENPEEQYIGPYHIHQDGTLMIGEGVLGIDHDIIPSEIIFQKVTYASIQQTREVVSDIFYKIWFESNTLTDDDKLTDADILSMQTTIRDGIKQTGRTEDEPLVFYKKDRNTLENRKDLQGDTFEQMCQYIFDNNITELEGKFSLEEVPGPTLDGQQVIQYKINFDNDRYKITVAQKTGDTFTDILNLSQLTKPKTGSKINPDKAREVLDTDIFELLPNQTTRQDTINRFFRDFDLLVGNRPTFTDENNDGFPEFTANYDADEQSRISVENPLSTASITRLDIQANTINETKTLQSMRNKLNEFLKDADSRLVLGDAADAIDGVTQTVDANGNIIYRYRLQDLQPEYENKSNGFLKIRKPNQAIIIRGQNNNLLEFQKLNANGTPSYLSDGFTITMWVRFVDKQSSGTLFNFGNPLEENGSGFRLETRTSIDSNKNYRRWIRLVVKDDLIRDNHFGDVNVKRRSASISSPLNYYNETNFHKLYPEIPTDDLNEWYFICATYNPNVIEPDNFDNNYEYIQNKQFWLNHIKENGEVVANSNLGAKCKVEIISRTDLLKARGYKVDDISVTAPLVDISSDDEEPPFNVDEPEDIDPLVRPAQTQEETSDVEPNPTLAPNGFNPMTNPMTGTLSPQGQWSWNGVSMTWLPVEIEEEEETEEEDPFFNDGDTSESDADNEDNKNVETDKGLTDAETEDFDDGFGNY